jgi:uncharacterized protein (DUF2147 family)
MKTFLITLQAATVLLMVVATSHAMGQATPAGVWQSIDDETGKPRAEISITELQGVAVGRIVRSLVAANSTAIQLCDKCSDDRAGKPLIGMEIIRKLTRNPDTGDWEGGEILDPDKGKTYPLRVKVIDGGKKLQVRGYIGPFFRTQIWQRIS